MGTGKYVKVVYNKEFDVVGGYIGGFDDIPTKQDKFTLCGDKFLKSL